MSAKPSAEERLRRYPRVRWCKACDRFTDGTYAIPSGGLCGPGCFDKCETMEEIRADQKSERREEFVNLARRVGPPPTTALASGEPGVTSEPPAHAAVRWTKGGARG